jgi:drug/metabolite transporter (DMT)-like permease
MVGFAGVAVLVGLDATGDLVGQLAVVLASLSYAVGLVYVRSKVSGRAAPLSMSLIQLIIASLLVVPAAAVDVTIAPPSWGWGSALAVTALGAFGTGIAYVLFFRLIQDVGATSASFVTYLIPIFGVFLGVVFLDESLGWNALLGATLVIAGIALAERARRAEGVVRKEPSDAEKVAEAAAGSVTE